MIEFQLWMFPIFAGVVIYVTHRIFIWRLDQADKRWSREQAEKAHGTAAE